MTAEDPSARAATPSTAPRAGGPAALIARARRWLSEQPSGLYGPGIRLLRNLSLARKTALVGLMLLLPGGMLMQDAIQLWRDHLVQVRLAVDGQDRYRTVIDLNLMIGRLAREVFFREQAMPHGDVAALRRQEAETFARLQQQLDALPEAAVDQVSALSAVRKRLQARHELMLARLDSSDAALRWQALFDCVAELDALRGVLVTDWSLAVDLDPGSKMLRTGLVDPQFQMLMQMQRLAGKGFLRLRGDTADERLHEMLLLQGRVEMLSDQARPMVAQTLLMQLLDVDGVQRDLGAIRVFLSTSARLTGAAPAGIDPQAYSRQALAAIEASARLQHLALEQIGRRMQQREATLVDRLGLRLGVLGVLALIGLYLLVCLYRVMSGGLGTLCRHLDRLGQGDLSARPRGWGRDEIGHALNTLGRATANISALFEAVQQGVAAVTHASREVAVGNSGLSGRTGEVRDALGRVIESAQHFSTAMDACAHEVDDAAEHVRAMRVEAQRSRKAMDDLRERMHALQVKSREIVHIVGLVEAVAFQTKLLSLNASVEAARAGSASRGFSVVAQEVRALAQRSEDAAAKIRAIVEVSAAEIEQGSVMAERAGRAVGRTDEEIHAVDRIMASLVHVTLDSREQSQQVLDIVREVDGSVQANVALVGQLSEASGGLRHQGDALKRSVSHFVVR
ncbi:methyl-accepting chemotaxis protein [Sphaerotilus uruguayifluvii]|uniref:Methyl-accepting chemotaxis protein n=1 Tax=Sphaerotilus uruguayifluvii TaxID=2735897 RepID=A0ABX2FZZ7_9BURK|nr:methyl-accepting chemotaxis protein [Leptothrix sp. C29]NRT55605.1 methyl-accepting chemotaxis protein [Leptothrix sp. C29]